MDRVESLLHAGNGNNDPAISAPDERRDRRRVRVHWRVLLFRGPTDEDAEETITENLSSDGFYCFSARLFSAGELLFSQLHLPTANSGCGASYLECRVRVVRVEKHRANDANYGMACRIEEYRVVRCNSCETPACSIEEGSPAEPSGELYLRASQPEESRAEIRAR